MFTMGGGSIGFQIGGSATDIVMIVMKATGAEKMMGNKTQLGADASVAGGPVGRTSQAATDLQMHAEILTYSRARGLFAGISLKGAFMKTDGEPGQCDLLLAIPSLSHQKMMILKIFAEDKNAITNRCQ